MLQKVVDFPAQISAAYSLLSGQIEQLPDFNGGFSSIVIVGMGGSGIAGDFVRVLLSNSNIPVHVCKNSRLPRFVNSKSLVVAVTYSGKTQETLAALDASVNAGAKCIVITSSRELELVCQERNISCISIPWNSYSRASFGYILLPLVGILNKAGLFSSIDTDISEAITVLNQIKQECSPEVPERKNVARLLSLALADRLPVIYGVYNFTDVIAVRWKQQLNENSKVHCYHDVFPELIHNEIEVWDAKTAQSCTLIILRDEMNEFDNGLEDRIQLTKNLATNNGTKVFELWTRGKSELARLLSLSYYGDFVSVYLAELRAISPEITSNINYIKGQDTSQKQGSVITK